MASDVRLIIRHWLIPLLMWNAVLVGLVLLPYFIVWLINQRTQSVTDEFGMPMAYQHFVSLEIAPSALIGFFAAGNVFFGCACAVRFWLNRTSREEDQSLPASNKGTEKLIVKETIPIESVLGKKLVAVYAIHWQSETCNLARFIFELEDSVCITWGEKPALHECCECQVVQRDSRWEKVTQIQYDSNTESRILGEVIVDILMPVTEDERNADSYVIEMSTGVGLTQVSGEPVGILPAVYLCEIDRAAFISLCDCCEP